MPGRMFGNRYVPSMSVTSERSTALFRSSVPCKRTVTLAIPCSPASTCPSLSKSDQTRPERLELITLIVFVAGVLAAPSSSVATSVTTYVPAVRGVKLKLLDVPVETTLPPRVTVHAYDSASAAPAGSNTWLPNGIPSPTSGLYGGAPGGGAGGAAVCHVSGALF